MYVYYISICMFIIDIHISCIIYVIFIMWGMDACAHAYMCTQTHARIHTHPRDTGL